MKAGERYHIATSINSVRTIRDSSDGFYVPESENKNAQLAGHFRDSLLLFRARVELLGSFHHITTDAEADSMSVMLTALVKAKQKLQSK